MPLETRVAMDYYCDGLFLLGCQKLFPLPEPQQCAHLCPTPSPTETVFRLHLATAESMLALLGATGAVLDLDHTPQCGIQPPAPIAMALAHGLWHDVSLPLSSRWDQRADACELRENALRQEQLVLRIHEDSSHRAVSQSASHCHSTRQQPDEERVGGKPSSLKVA